MNGKIIKSSNLIPVKVLGNNEIKTKSKHDTVDSFLDAKINKEIERATEKEDDLQRQIDNLKEFGFSVKDVVATHQDLIDYDTSNLLDKDVIIVIDDGGYSSFYRWCSVSSTFISLGSSSYTIDQVDRLILDLQNQIDYLGSKGAIRDVVLSHQDLINYDISSLIENDIVIVLSDEVLNKATTYYKKDSSGNMVICGTLGPTYYTKDEIDAMIIAINETLADHEERITDNRNELDFRITEEEAYDILSN